MSKGRTMQSNKDILPSPECSHHCLMQPLLRLGLTVLCPQHQLRAMEIFHRQPGSLPLKASRPTLASAAVRIMP
jgi:hypothetical protein